jgi:hypothetical protein
VPALLEQGRQRLDTRSRLATPGDRVADDPKLHGRHHTKGPNPRACHWPPHPADPTVISKSFYDEQLAYHRPGDVVKLEVKRDKELKTINIQLVNNQGTTEMIKRISYKSESLGAEFELVSKLERERYDIEFGVKVSNITSGKIRSMNIEEGFIFTSINQKEFSDLKSFVSYLEEITGQVKVEGVSPSGVRRYMSFYIR